MNANRQDPATIITRVRKLLIGIGTAMLVPSSIYGALGMFGLVRTDILAIGATSGIRVLASIAVLGCIMAAVGYWEN